MRVIVFRLLAVSIVVLGLAFSGSLLAQQKKNTSTNNEKSTNSVVEIISQGSGICNSYAIASIKEMGGNVSSGQGSFSSTDGSATYTLQSGTNFSFTSTLKINFAVLKSGSNVRIFYYPPGGLVSDGNMRLPVNGVFQTIESARLCYGQDGKFTAVEPPPVVIPSCSDLEAAGILDQSEIFCPVATDEQRVIISLDPSQPDWNPTLCTCNTSFEECDAFAQEEANATMQDVPERFCPSGAGLRALPTVIEAGNDGTWVCTTSGGTRTCYKVQ